MQVLSGPNDICGCGHVKNFHAYINAHPAPGEPVVTFGKCCKCPCQGYLENPDAAPTPPEAPPTGPVLSAPRMEDVIHELRAALTYACKRISDLGDQKARLQGQLAGGLNRIQELEKSEAHHVNCAVRYIKMLEEGLSALDPTRNPDHPFVEPPMALDDWVPFCRDMHMERNALREGLEGLREECSDKLVWLRHKLETAIAYVPGAAGNYGAKGPGGWSAVQIPDWDVKQKMQSIEEALASAQALLGKGAPIDPDEPTGTADDRIPRATVDAMRTLVGDCSIGEIHESIRALVADPERVRLFNNLTPEQARELLSSNPVHWGTADRQTMTSPTERPIQAGDTVRHKTKGWEKTVKRILPALPEKSLAVMALFDGGDRYPLSELERVEPAEPEHGKGKPDGQKD